MTPAQEAKEYAAANGFTIKTKGKRYVAFYNANGQERAFERGSYTALLNEMRYVTTALARAAVLENLVPKTASGEWLDTMAKLPRKEKRPLLYEVIVDLGYSVVRNRCISRREAVKVLRQFLSGPLGRKVVHQRIYYLGA